MMTTPAKSVDVIAKLCSARAIILTMKSSEPRQVEPLAHVGHPSAQGKQTNPFSSALEGSYEMLAGKCRSRSVPLK